MVRALLTSNARDRVSEQGIAPSEFELNAVFGCAVHDFNFLKKSMALYFEHSIQTLCHSAASASNKHLIHVVQ